MLLSTHTKEELLVCLKKADELLFERALSYGIHNYRKEISRYKNLGKYTRVFSCEYENQRYYKKFIFHVDNKTCYPVLSSNLYTELKDSSRTFVIVYASSENKFGAEGHTLKLLTGHFISRYYERTSKEMKPGLSLCEKAMEVLGGNQAFTPLTVVDDIIKRNSEPALNMKFLSEGRKEIVCAHFSNGDISIVEHYGDVSVWRTYITKEMLFDDQIEAKEALHLEEKLEIAKEIDKYINPEHK